MDFALTSKKLFVFLESGVLEKGNQERCVRIFYDVAKIVHYRQERLNKPQLKMKEIASALILVEFFHSSTYRFEATGDLARNFGQCPEGQAVDYFEHSSQRGVYGVSSNSYFAPARIPSLKSFRICRLWDAIL